MKILFVEDNVDDVSLIKAVLKNENCTLEFAATFKEGLEKKKSFEPDLVVLDVNLPDSSAMNTVRNIRLLNQTCALVILTGDENTKHILEAAEAGADDYIFKRILTNGPELFEKLLKSWAGWKNKSSQVSPLSNIAIKKADIPTTELMLILKYQNDAVEKRDKQVDKRLDSLMEFMEGIDTRRGENHELYMKKFTSIESKQDHTNGSVSTLQAEVLVLKEKDKKETDEKIKKAIEEQAVETFKSKRITFPKLSKYQWGVIGSILVFFGYDKLIALFHSISHFLSYLMTF